MAPEYRSLGGVAGDEEGFVQAVGISDSDGVDEGTEEGLDDGDRVGGIKGINVGWTTGATLGGGVFLGCGVLLATGIVVVGVEEGCGGSTTGDLVGTLVDALVGTFVLDDSELVGLGPGCRGADGDTVGWVDGANDEIFVDGAHVVGDMVGISNDNVIPNSSRFLVNKSWSSSMVGAVVFIVAPIWQKQFEGGSRMSVRLLSVSCKFRASTIWLLKVILLLQLVHRPEMESEIAVLDEKIVGGKRFKTLGMEDTDGEYEGAVDRGSSW
eukprot:CAMPEP_0170343318 /NCGR_PEP_ID=MMETSP0116_2-20130129/72831_1 /TAXON_ID=400756 /ORGANISM="Durinskia baltica, Strain CSIRO CS-38" /LENGTH=267 /DNA_ID=CAMNT_0010596965 /DNA_START=396 /DNA_END=1197 /DNA_ORIENTATION=+